MNAEHNGYMIEIKEVGADGTFKGIASPFGNVDFGGDRVMPTVAKRNNGKKNIPYLWQHDSKNPIGAIDLKATSTAIEVDGRLILDANEQGIPKVPDAHKAHALMQAGLLSNSIGYITLDKKFVTENGRSVRELIDIDIKEVSAVTFPMNDQAVITQVKEEGKRMEQKALSFTETLNIQNAQEMRWKLMDALNASFRGLVEDDSMTVDEKVTQLTENVSDFSAAYLENMTTLLKATTKNPAAKKSVIDSLETKSTAKVDEPAENNDNVNENGGEQVDDSQEEKKQAELDVKSLESVLKNMKGEKQDGSK